MTKKLYRKSELKLITGLLAYKKRDFQNINRRINKLNEIGRASCRERV